MRSTARLAGDRARLARLRPERVGRRATATGFRTTWPISTSLLDHVQAGAPAHVARTQHGRQYRVALRGRAPAAGTERHQPRGARPPLQPPEQAPGRFAQWFDELKAGGSLRDYADRTEVAARLRRNNPRLSVERAAFLAEHWAEPDGHGRFRVAGDPAHRIVNPVLYRLDEAMACWKAVTSPALMVLATETDALAPRGARPRAGAGGSPAPLWLGSGRRAGHGCRRRPHAASRPAGGRCATDRGIPAQAGLRRLAAR